MAMRMACEASLVCVQALRVATWVAKGMGAVESDATCVCVDMSSAYSVGLRGWVGEVRQEV